MKKLLKNLILFAVIAFCDFAHQAVSQTSQFKMSLQDNFNPEASCKLLAGLKPVNNGIRKKDRTISISDNSEYLHIPINLDKVEALQNHIPLPYVETLPECKPIHIGVTVSNSSDFQDRNYDNNSYHNNSVASCQPQSYNPCLSCPNQTNSSSGSVVRSNDKAIKNDSLGGQSQKSEMPESNSVAFDYEKPSKKHVDDYDYLSPIKDSKKDVQIAANDQIATNSEIDVEDKSVSSSSSDTLVQPILPILEQEINVDKFINKNLEDQQTQEFEMDQEDLQMFTGDQNKKPEKPVVITPENAEVPEPTMIEANESPVKIELSLESVIEILAIVKVVASVLKNTKAFYKGVNPAIFKYIVPKVIIDDLPAAVIASKMITDISKQSPVALPKESIMKKILNNGGGLWAAFIEKIKNIKLVDIEDGLISDNSSSSDSTDLDSGSELPKSISDDDLIDCAIDKFIQDRIEDGSTTNICLPSDCCTMALPASYAPSLESCIATIASSASNIKCLP